MALYVLEIKNVYISFVPGVFAHLVTRMRTVQMVNFVATNMCLLLKMFVLDIVTKFVSSVRHAEVLAKLVGGDLHANKSFAQWVLGVRIRKLKVDFKTGGTWRWVRQ